MKNFKTKEEAFASQNYNPESVVINGVPEHIIEAAKGFINLCVAHDAVNPEFDVDPENYDQRKFTAWHELGSSSGVGFACGGYGFWDAGSYVGSRLSSESREAANHIAELFHEDYKAMKVYKREIKNKE